MNVNKFPSSFVSSADRIKTALLANANESGSQRGLLLPWLFGGEDSLPTQISSETSLMPVSDSLSSSFLSGNGVTNFPNGHGRAAEITQMYKSLKGIESLYPWQDDCLNCEALSERRNLIIAMPTSAGKTLVAEIVMLREIMIYNRAVMLVLPYVSLVQEKVRGLIPLSLRFGFSVEEYAGGHGTFPPPIRRRRQSLYVATIEKASSLISAFIDPTLHGNKKRSVRDVGLVIVDEVHMIGDGERGAVLEASLVKLRAGFPNAQIVTMSATVGNLNELAACFNADIFHRDFRPVPLHEYVMCNKTLYRFVHDKKNGTGSLEPTTNDKQPASIILPGSKPHPALEKLDKNTLALIKRIDTDDLFGLVGDLILENKQCLVFCATRRAAENAALLIAKIMSLLSPFIDVFGDRTVGQKRATLVAQMISENEGQCCPILQKTIPAGIAYHHAGLMPDERFAVEQAYIEGLITVLCCTSTLAAGVNLPARRVVIRSPYVASVFLTPDRYRQMAGRAGRAKLDTLGQSVIMCTPNDLQKVASMMAAPLAPCISCLPSVLPTLCLELICIGLVNSVQSMNNIISSFSLWHRQRKSDAIPLDEELTKVLTNLVDTGLLYYVDVENAQLDEEKHFRPTALGRAAMAANLAPQAAHRLMSDLKQCQSMLTLASPIHLLFVAIPVENVPELIDSIDFSILAREINSLQQAADLDALKLLNLTESYVARMRGTGSSMLSISSSSTPQATVKAALPYARLQLALALRAIWYGANYWDAASRLGLSRGSVFQLMSTATAYAHAAHRFSTQIPELWPLSDLMLSLNRRLLECPLADLAELMNIPGVQYGRAKQLGRAGYTSLAALATADPVQLTREIEHLPRRTAIAIVEAAQLAVRENLRQLQDAAESIVEDTVTAALSEPKLTQIPAQKKS